MSSKNSSLLTPLHVTLSYISLESTSHIRKTTIIKLGKWMFCGKNPFRLGFLNFWGKDPSYPPRYGRERAEVMIRVEGDEDGSKGEDPSLEIMRWAWPCSMCRGPHGSLVC